MATVALTSEGGVAMRQGGLFSKTYIGGPYQTIFSHRHPQGGSSKAKPTHTPGTSSVQGGILEFCRKNCPTFLGSFQIFRDILDRDICPLPFSVAHIEPNAQKKGGSHLKLDEQLLCPSVKRCFFTIHEASAIGSLTAGWNWPAEAVEYCALHPFRSVSHWQHPFPFVSCMFFPKKIWGH